MMAAQILEKINFLVSRRPYRLYEIADLPIILPILREGCQAMLTEQWTRKLPLVQAEAPAELAARLLRPVLDKLAADARPPLSVVDFCSGGGGPIPAVEKIINRQRAIDGLPAIPFVLSDLHPDIDDWMDTCSKSANLSFVPQRVDAINPPAAVLNDSIGTSSANGFHSGNRIFRVYCLSFHHFSDDAAAKVLKSAMETSDGFAIIELQDRRLTSLLLMLLEPFLILLCTVFWFKRRPAQLLFTYLIPILPWMMLSDGVVSCLRTRTFDEILRLADVAARKSKLPIKASSLGRDGGLAKKRKIQNDWLFEGGRSLHTWPLGYANWVVATRLP